MKCTIQDIARETELSRNTVSKALRDSPEVSKKTKNKVIAKANELGYFDISKINQKQNNNSNGSILFLTTNHAKNSEFWTTVLSGIEDVLYQNNYQITMSLMTVNDLIHGNLPTTIHNSDIKGVIVVEICYQAVWRSLLKLNKPIITVDAPKDYSNLIGKCDIVMMENKINIISICQKLFETGLRDFAFIGDLYSENTGLGFLERYQAVKQFLKTNELKLNQTASITHNSNNLFENFEILKQQLSKIKKMPDVFICGNDWAAIQLIYGLQSLDYQIPKDINIVGFDNISLSEKIQPTLSTIDTPKEYLGIVAARRIIEKINKPETPFGIMTFSTKPILRETTDINVNK